ncbi:hypothetical protein D3C80_1719860 [compost metagenome]
MAAISLVLLAAKPWSANSSLAARKISSLLRSRILVISPCACMCHPALGGGRAW